MKDASGFSLVGRKGLIAATSLLLFSATAASGHDSFEITTDVYLRTNSLELRVTLAAQTARHLLAADGHGVAALATVADLEGARPLLAASAVELIAVSAANRPLVALQTNVALSVEDHLEFKLIYPRPDPGVLRFNATGLKKLPADEPYGALLTVVDVANGKFLGQKLLTLREPSFEVRIAAPPPAGSSVRPAAAALRTHTNSP